MDLYYATGAGGSLNNQNSNLNGYVGMGLQQDKFSLQGDTGLELNAKEGGIMFARGSIAYNDDVGVPYAEGGIFAKGSVKVDFGLESQSFVDGFGIDYADTNFVNKGQTCSAEVGYRINSDYSDTHSNISAFDELTTTKNGQDNVLGAKYELSDGNKSLFAKAGVESDEQGSKPYIGVGGRIDLKSNF